MNYYINRIYCTAAHFMSKRILPLYDLAFSRDLLSSLVNGKSTLKWDAFVMLLVTKQVD